MKKFDYAKAIAALEEIAKKVEDPTTGVEEVDKYITETEKLVKECREYLRTIRDKVDDIDS